MHKGFLHFYIRFVILFYSYWCLTFI